MLRLSRTRLGTLQTVGALSAVGLSFVLAVVMGAGFGYLLDSWLGSSPWFFLVFFFLGVTAGVLNVFRVSESFLNDRQGGGPGTASN
jgi:F0F1-type ATP synthase assembly protein I